MLDNIKHLCLSVQVLVFSHSEQHQHLFLSVQVLVFSHSVRMLDIIERLVIMAGYVYSRLDGSVKQQDRQTKVNEFNTSASVFLFLISTTAGGLGLNLTAANR